MREEVAKKIHWTSIIWLVSVANPFMIAPQLWQIWHTGETAGLSLAFFSILFPIQSGFSLHGFFTRDRFIMLSNGVTAAMTLLTVLSAAYFRHLGA